MPVHLDRIFICNFKSFKGDVIIGPLKRFSAITGPNGCGKSNMMDALSFVMGEKTINLRVKQLKDLISGTNIGKPVANSAHVTAVFILEDGTNKRFTRRIIGTSCEYNVNDKVVLLEAYISELKKLGINVKAKNFLIFQGTVESILMKTSKELTAVFEEISTSVELKTDYERLTREVYAGQNGVLYANKIKQACLAQKNQALLEKEEADKYNMLHNKYVKLRSKFQLFELFHIKMDIENLKETVNTKQEEINHYELDKELAQRLLNQEKQQMHMLSNRLQNMEKDLIKMETAFKTKEAPLTVVKEKISYWQNTLNTANSSLAQARKAYDVHVKTIQELKEEIIKVESMQALLSDNMASQTSSQSSVDLDDKQVAEYFRLKGIVSEKSIKDIKHLDSLKSKQSKDQNKLDDAIRQRTVSETKLRQQETLKNELKKRVAALRRYINEIEDTLINESDSKRALEDAISSHGDKIENLQNELEKVSKQLQNVETDKYIDSRIKKKAETIRILQDMFPDVYGRVHTICNPIHSRYNIAVTKVLGGHMESIIVATNKIAIACVAYLKDQKIDVETFLPLDSLKTEPLQDRLRHISEPSGTKLLYDVINFAPKEIDNAVLFLTKNTLVCETMDDASKVAYKMNPGCTFDCVALDGTFYRKSGIFSGGLSDLAKRAKIWDKKEFSELKSRKVALVKELRKMSTLEQDMSMLNIKSINVDAVTKRLKYAKHELSEIETQLAEIQNMLEVAETNLQMTCNTIAPIEETMKERNHDIERIETRISNIQNDVFKEFCRSFGLASIQDYERRNLRVYKEQANRRLELDQQYDRIQNLLKFEMARDTKSAILKYENTVRRAEAKLDKLRETEGSCRVDIENMESDLKLLRAECKATTTNVAEQEKIVKECRDRMTVIAKLIRSAQRECMIVLRKIEEKKAEWREIHKISKTENINIPVNLEDSRSSSSMNQTTPSTDESGAFELFSRVDFSGLSENMKSRVKEDMNNARIELTSAITETEEEIKCIKVPNLKAAERVSATIEQLKNANKECQETRKRVRLIQNELTRVKHERYQRFVCCFEYIAEKIDDIYKSLYNDSSAQAIIVPKNPEEPYLGGIEYNCVVPKKRFQPLSNLSGGEKTFASLALLFAMHSFKPAPFIMMDEFDANLDNVNIKNFVRFVRSRQIDIQFVVISLNPRTCAHADFLFGITRDEEPSTSRVFSLNWREYPVPNI